MLRVHSRFGLGRKC